MTFEDYRNERRGSPTPVIRPGDQAARSRSNRLLQLTSR